MLQVLEETGFDIEDLVQEDDFIELTLDGKRNKLFIVAGLDPNSAQFAPKCKGVSALRQSCSLQGECGPCRPGPGLLSFPCWFCQQQAPLHSVGGLGAWRPLQTQLFRWSRYGCVG